MNKKNKNASKKTFKQTPNEHRCESRNKFQRRCTFLEGHYGKHIATNRDWWTDHTPGAYRGSIQHNKPKTKRVTKKPKKISLAMDSETSGLQATALVTKVTKRETKLDFNDVVKKELLQWREEARLEGFTAGVKKGQEAERAAHELLLRKTRQPPQKTPEERAVLFDNAYSAGYQDALRFMKQFVMSEIFSVNEVEYSKTPKKQRLSVHPEDQQQRTQKRK